MLIAFFRSWLRWLDKNNDVPPIGNPFRLPTIPSPWHVPCYNPAMSTSFVFSLMALAAMVPVPIVRFRAGEGRDALFWGVLLLAVAGPGAWAVAQFHESWRTSFAVALWVSIAATMGLFCFVAAFTRQGWRLTLLLVPYLLILGGLATIWGGHSARPLAGGVPAGWVDVHIVLAVVTYGLLTIAAVAGTAVLLQEEALKAKRTNALSRRLPALSDAERLEVTLLWTVEAVLACGLISGMAAQHFLDGRLLAFDHKTVFSLASFAVIGTLLLAHRRTGIRGRRAARFVLLAYLLLTLGFLGVKFVTDVIMVGAGP